MTQASAPERWAADALAPWLIAVVCLAGIGYVGAGLQGLQTSVETLVSVENRGMEQVKVTKWYSADPATGVCILQIVETPKGTMNRVQWQAAHDEAVADMKASHPPSPACPIPQ